MGYASDVAKRLTLPSTNSSGVAKWYDDGRGKVAHAYDVHVVPTVETRSPCDERVSTGKK